MRVKLGFLLVVVIVLSSCLRIQQVTVLPPSYSAESILPGESRVARPLEPGMVMSLYGEHLGPQTACFGLYNPARAETPNPGRRNQSEVETRSYPKRLCDTEVTVGGIAAGLIYVQAGQINFKVPQEVAVSGTAIVQVRYKGQAGPAVTERLSAGER